MVERPNNPVAKARELQRRLFIAAKRHQVRRFHAISIRTLQGNVLPVAWRRYDVSVSCMPDEKTIGKPYAGNSHVRFERGPQVVGSVQMNTSTIT